MSRTVRITPEATYVSVSDAARRIGESQYLIRRRVKEGKVPFLVFGDTVRIHFPALRASMQTSIE